MEAVRGPWEYCSRLGYGLGAGKNFVDSGPSSSMVGTMALFPPGSTSRNPGWR
jgi:hypothetical protein